MPDSLSVAFPVLIGDIGGTNARFAVIASETAPAERLADSRTAEYATIEDAIEAALTGRAGTRPKTAILALAAPIDGEAIDLTNSAWIVTPKALIARFGFAEVILLNDFEAQALALADLGPGDIDPIGGGEAEANRTRVVVGPGTGLGVGALIHGGTHWIPVPGEGGHIDLSPISDRDYAIWPHIEKFGASNRVSGETVLCGSGMVRLYRAICAADGVRPAFADPADISAHGLAGTDPQAKETLSLFAIYLGRVAGDLALIFTPHGGVYLAGGISPKIAAALHEGGFREAFVEKAPHRALLDTFATAIITKPDAALAGIAAFARRPDRFEMDLSERRWRPNP
jgi:glucokinase